MKIASDNFIIKSEDSFCPPIYYPILSTCLLRTYQRPDRLPIFSLP